MVGTTLHTQHPTPYVSSRSTGHERVLFFCLPERVRAPSTSCPFKRVETTGVGVVTAPITVTQLDTDGPLNPLRRDRVVHEPEQIQN